MSQSYSYTSVTSTQVTEYFRKPSFLERARSFATNFARGLTGRTVNISSSNVRYSSGALRGAFSDHARGQRLKNTLFPSKSQKRRLSRMKEEASTDAADYRSAVADSVLSRLKLWKGALNPLNLLPWTKTAKKRIKLRRYNLKCQDRVIKIAHKAGVSKIKALKCADEIRSKDQFGRTYKSEEAECRCYHDSMVEAGESMGILTPGAISLRGKKTQTEPLQASSKVVPLHSAKPELVSAGEFTPVSLDSQKCRGFRGASSFACRGTFSGSDVINKCCRSCYDFGRMKKRG